MHDVILLMMYICMLLLKINTYITVHVKTKNIPVILISAFPNSKDVLIRAGANDFIPKPFDINDLLSRVEKQLAN